METISWRGHEEMWIVKYSFFWMVWKLAGQDILLGNYNSYSTCLIGDNQELMHRLTETFIHSPWGSSSRVLLPFPDCWVHQWHCCSCVGQAAFQKILIWHQVLTALKLCKSIINSSELTSLTQYFPCEQNIRLKSRRKMCFLIMHIWSWKHSIRTDTAH